MKCLSIRQPWASLIASGAKRIETRGWAPQRLTAGQFVAIHAGTRWTARERQLCAEDPLIKRLLDQAAVRDLWRFEQPPLGCVVAIARFAQYAPVSALAGISPQERRLGDYRPGRFGWIFSAVQPVSPIPLRGRLGLFDWQPQKEVVYLEPVNQDTTLY
ncbi:MAG TPA: ASCH domain-containing protein [Ktedonobacterales bacterium]